MKNHKVNFGSQVLLDFFYQLGIGCNSDRKKAIEFYLLSVNNETENDSSNKHFTHKNNKTFNINKRNIIIEKYLLSMFYYKDIIFS
jgi:hypothetical protein